MSNVMEKKLLLCFEQLLVIFYKDTKALFIEIFYPKKNSSRN